MRGWRGEEAGVIIDTHLHIIDKAALRYPWLSGVPALDRDFTYDDYATEARRGGIEGTLHMEVDVDPADIDAALAVDHIARSLARDLLLNNAVKAS